jgi:hypothetical protein
VATEGSLPEACGTRIEPLLPLPVFVLFTRIIFPQARESGENELCP